MFCSLSVKMTDAEIKECIRRLYPFCIKNNKGFLVSVSDYDNDPRDLWDIPEAVSFFKRLIDIGFLSVLEVMVQQETMPGCPGLGALEVWFIATRRIQARGDYEVDQNDWIALKDILVDCRLKTEKIIAEPSDPSIEIEEIEEIISRAELSEGSHRHSNRRKL